MAVEAVFSLLGFAGGWLAFSSAEGFCRDGSYRIDSGFLGWRQIVFSLLMACLGFALSARSFPALNLPVVLLLGMLAHIDARRGLLPNVLVLILLLFALAYAACTDFTQGLYGLLLTGGMYGAFYLIGYMLLRREPMGMGDIKLISACGLWLGLEKSIAAALLAPPLATAALLALWLVKRGEPVKTIPFGPALAAAAIFSYFFAENWIARYMAWIL